MNMREIARRAGVSNATVSRVLNGSPLVSEETAERVRRILDEANYIPNPSAATLKYGRSKTYGLIIPDICNPFFAESVAAFEDLLIEMDYEVLLTSVQTPEKLLKSIRRMLMRKVDGVVIMASEFETHAVESLLLHNIPMVTVDRRSAQRGCSDVAIDYETGFAEAVRYLKSLGHRRIGYIGGMKGPQTSHDRAEAFRLAIQNAGLVYNPQLTRCGDYRVGGGEEAVLSLFQTASPPSAILTANDLTAIGAIQGLHRLSHSVPRDLSVIGIDDLQLSSVIQPPLTTIRIPRQRLAKACIEALDVTRAAINRRGSRFAVATELIVRESTAPVRQKTVSSRKRSPAYA